MKTRDDAIDPVHYFGKLLGLDSAGMTALVKRALFGAEDGELFLQRSESESVSLNDGRVQSPSRSVDQGFGLRRVNGESVLYAHGNTISTRAIVRAGKELREIATAKQSYVMREVLPQPMARYAGTLTPLSLAARVKVLRAIDRYARKDKVVTNVSAFIASGLTYVLIVRADGTVASDVRPMTKLFVSVQCALGEKRESGDGSIAGRYDYSRLIAPNVWMPEVDLAIHNAKETLRAGPCPSGIMPVVLGPGWAGVLLHEAIGHGLEADCVWRKTTVFADLVGKRVASELVTVVDDGTLQDERGSLTIDDEGTPTERTVLIKDGILVGFMHDRQSARLLNMRATGSGRRESYEHRTQVRMRNTLMESGVTPPEDIIAATKHGLYMPSFSGGQVDPVTGQFVFGCELAYKIEDGKLTTPVVGATLIGNCTTVLTFVDLVGNDSKLGGAGTCGKGGQSVPVGIGQPTLRLSGGVTVGGTETAAE